MPGDVSTFLIGIFVSSIRIFGSFGSMFESKPIDGVMFAAGV